MITSWSTGIVLCIVVSNIIKKLKKTIVGMKTQSIPQPTPKWLFNSHEMPNNIANYWNIWWNQEYK